MDPSAQGVGWGWVATKTDQFSLFQWDLGGFSRDIQGARLNQELLRTVQQRQAQFGPESVEKW
jgi:hypothetical protein